MANRKTHERFNLFWGLSISLGLFFYMEIEALKLSVFLGGWLFATYFFSPDSDLMPARRASFFRVFLYPYSMFFRHRGISHGPFLGTLTRVIYLLLISFLIGLIFIREGYATFGEIKSEIFNFFGGNGVYLLGWALVGWYLADFFHILLDRLTSSLKRLFPFK